MLILALISILVSMISPSCMENHTIEGTVHDVTENTLTVALDEGRMVIFSTRDARMRCPAGIHRGSPVEVTFSDDVSDGFGNADRVVAPETYNRLLGRWVAPCVEDPEMKHGFELLDNGDVIEIGDHSIPYNCWRLDDEEILMAECAENLDGDLCDSAHRWHIESLDHSMLVVGRNGVREAYARSSR